MNTTRSILTWLALLSLLGGRVSAEATTTESLSQYGLTWTLTKPAKAGKFVTLSPPFLR